MFEVTPDMLMLVAGHRKNANSTLQCPVEPGDYVVAQTVALPKEIPPGLSMQAIYCTCR